MLDEYIHMWYTIRVEGNKDREKAQSQLPTTYTKRIKLLMAFNIITQTNIIINTFWRLIE